MTKNTKNYSDIVVNSLPEREVEIIGKISAEKMSTLREKALKKLKTNIELPGFRKGSAPDNLVASKIGEGMLLEEAAQMALEEEYANILEENKINAIGRPEITITKIGIGSPMEFKIKTSIEPNIKLADYKKISEKINIDRKDEEITVSDKEIDDVIDNIRHNIAHQKVHEEAGGGKEHNHRKVEDSDLPEVNNDFAKSIGNFENVGDMKEKIKESIKKEKELKEKDKLRIEIIEKIINESEIELPKIIIDGELDKMVAQFKDDLAKNGVSFEDYLKHINKKEEDMRIEWKETATKRAKSQIILNEISNKEDIHPKEEEIKKEMEHILSHIKDADRFRVRMYVETFLTNELVFQFLESKDK